MGPVNQLKKMFASTRIIATLVVLVSLGMTLFAAIGVSTKNILQKYSFCIDTKTQILFFFVHSYTKLGWLFCL